MLTKLWRRIRPQVICSYCGSILGTHWVWGYFDYGDGCLCPERLKYIEDLKNNYISMQQLLGVPEDTLICHDLSSGEIELHFKDVGMQIGKVNLGLTHDNRIKLVLE